MTGKGSNPEKKAASFWTFSKRGGGPTRIQKFWGSFFWAFFWTFLIEGGGLNQFQKFWGSFGYLFRYFLVFFS